MRLAIRASLHRFANHFAKPSQLARLQAESGGLERTRTARTVDGHHWRPPSEVLTRSALRPRAISPRLPPFAWALRIRATTSGGRPALRPGGAERLPAARDFVGGGGRTSGYSRTTTRGDGVCRRRRRGPGHRRRCRSIHKASDQARRLLRVALQTIGSRSPPAQPGWPRATPSMRQGPLNRSACRSS